MAFPSLSELSSLPVVAKTGLPGAGDLPDASQGLTALYAGLALLVVVPVLFFTIKKIARKGCDLRIKELREETLMNASRHEKAGEFVSAAALCEKLKDIERAAALYEKGRDYEKAAALHESLGQMEKAVAAYEKAGNLEKAAEIFMMTGAFLDAAKTYNRMGNKLKEAQAFEASGNNLAAARAYREARDYARAAALLKESGMLKEAAEMFGISLGAEEPAAENIDRFYRYASLLEGAGYHERACGVYRRILEVSPDYRDVREKVESFQCREGSALEGSGGAEPPALEHLSPAKASLRNILDSGKMEPRQSFRLWVQILKALALRRRAGSLPVGLSPESVYVSDNSITFEGKASSARVYEAPEGSVDQASSVYSMGVILYEMLTSGTAHLGEKRPRELAPDIPDWLDELTMKCLAAEREGRYRGFDDVFAAIKSLQGPK